MPDDDKLGTPEPQAADASEDTSTSGAEGMEGQGGLSPEDTEKLHLTWKAKAERVEALEAQLAALQAQQQPPAADEGEDDDEALIRENLELGQKDAAARLAAKNALYMRQLVREIGFSQQLRDIPDTQERKKVLEHFQKNRNRLGDPNAARAEIQAQEYAETNRKLAEENARMKKALEAAQVKPPDGVPTHLRGSPESTKGVRQMTKAQWDREIAAAEDNKDARFKLMNDRRHKKLVVEG